MDQWKRIFPKLFNENNGSKSKDAKTIIIETNVIRSDQIEQITEKQSVLTDFSYQTGNLFPGFSRFTILDSQF